MILKEGSASGQPRIKGRGVVVGGIGRFNRYEAEASGTGDNSVKLINVPPSKFVGLLTGRTHGEPLTLTNDEINTHPITLVKFTCRIGSKTTIFYKKE